MAVADPPSPVQVIAYEVVTAGVTTAEPDVAEAVKLLPVQDAALVEFRDRVEDCPELVVFGLAEEGGSRRRWRHDRSASSSITATVVATHP